MKAVLTVVYLVIGLVSLLASVCGGLVSIQVLLDGGRGAALLGISLPSLVVGALVFRLVQRRSRALDDPEVPHE